ncbi:MAG TPA: carbohydrate binding domain-containing protein [Termitinemataceae bacterium]|nr:carbohydrate binding domain-containing protein [Termitinemataceae bacterium]HOM24453.1 carbohydrate binding domain-containing protein [Termitinemataceae bacterium]HPQ00173.1 carbohydrate binding domain-containing protein [Termitinemataceae bacterium]
MKRSVFTLVPMLLVLVFAIGCASTESAAPSAPAAQAAPAAKPTPQPWTIDFEDGTTMGWAGNNATAAIAKDKVHGGTYSMRVVAGDAGWKTAWFYNCGDKILADVPYSYSAWIYQETGKEVKFNITIKTSMSAYKGAVYGATVPSGVWTEIKSDSFVLSSDSGKPQDIYIEAQTPGIVFYVDDIAILPK